MAIALWTIFVPAASTHRKAHLKGLLSSSWPVNTGSLTLVFLKAPSLSGWLAFAKGSIVTSAMLKEEGEPLNADEGTLATEAGMVGTGFVEALGPS